MTEETVYSRYTGENSRRRLGESRVNVTLFQVTLFQAGRGDEGGERGNPGAKRPGGKAAIRLKGKRTK